MGRIPHSGRVVVHTRRPDDQTIAGVLVMETRAGLRLEGAEYAVNGTERHRLENAVWIPREAVSWIELVS